MTAVKFQAYEQAPVDFASLYLAAITMLSMCLSITGLVFFFRSQLGDSNPLIFLRLFGLSGAFILLPTLLFSSRVLSRNLAASMPVLAVIGLGMLVCLAGRFPAANIVVYPFLLGVWLAGAHTLAQAQISARQCLTAVILGLPLGVLYFFILNTGGLANVFVPEAALLGLAHIDTLFHSAVAAMFSRYGVVTSGLDGLTPMLYHALSHFWLGSLGLWLDIPAIHVYAYGPQILGAPLLIFSTALATFALWRPRETVTTPFALIAIPLAFLSVFETKDWYSYLLSESYLFAVCLFLLTIPLLLRLSQLSGILKSPALLLSALFVTLVIAGTKLSVGFVLAIAIAVNIFMRILPERIFLFLVAVGVLSALWFLLWIYFGGDWPQGMFKFSVYPDTYPRSAYLNIGATIVAVTFLGAVAALDIRKRRIAGMLALASLASLVPTLTINMPAGAQYYFINVGVWIGIVAIGGLLILPAVSRSRYATAATVCVGAIFVVATFATPQKKGSISAFFRLASTAENTARDPHYVPPPLGTKLAISTFPDIIAKLPQLATNTEKTYAGRLRRSIDRQLPSTPPRTAVFIPSSATEFWDLQKDCRSNGFLVPAFLGVPLIYGLPKNCNPADYGFTFYRPDEPDHELSARELCLKARRVKEDRVLRVVSTDVVQNIDCMSKEEKSVQ